jgi:hypothetical protein
MAAVTPGPSASGWGLNIGGFMDAHRDWLIRGRGGGFGWTAQRRDATGRPRGPVVDARTLDELAALIQAARLQSPGQGI